MNKFLSFLVFFICIFVVLSLGALWFILVMDLMNNGRETWALVTFIGGVSLVTSIGVLVQGEY